jgi:hypothetical protein
MGVPLSSSPIVAGIIKAMPERSVIDLAFIPDPHKKTKNQ